MRIARDGLKLVAALVAVAVFAVLIDRSADLYAEARTSAAFGLAFESSVDVSIEGYPFLTQWRNGEYEKVRITANRLSMGGSTLKKVRLRLTDVAMPEYATGPEQMVKAKAGKARLAATVPYDDLDLPLNIKVKHKAGTDDQVRLTGRMPVTVLGQRLKVPFAANVRLSVKNGKVQLQPRKVEVPPGVSNKTVDGLVRRHLSRSVEPPGLPKSMELQQLTATDAGLRSVATGKNVRLPKQ